MRVLDTFSGIGCFSLGLERAGFETVAFCEISEFPRKVLAKHWPDVPIYEDVRDVSKQRLDEYGIRCDVVTGGFPCQDISSAGSGEGIDGERSSLWKEMCRVISEVRPRNAWLENSPLLVERGLAVVIGDLTEIGYDLRWCVLGSDNIGASHHRKRFWGLATNSECVGQSESRGYDNAICEAKADDRQTDWFKRILQGRTMPYVCGENHGMADGVDRLRAVGNGQDPRTFRLAWDILNG